MQWAYSSIGRIPRLHRGDESSILSKSTAGLGPISLVGKHWSYIPATVVRFHHWALSYSYAALIAALPSPWVERDGFSPFPSQLPRGSSLDSSTTHTATGGGRPVRHRGYFSTGHGMALTTGPLLIGSGYGDIADRHYLTQGMA